MRLFGVFIRAGRRLIGGSLAPSTRSPGTPAITCSKDGLRQFFLLLLRQARTQFLGQFLIQPGQVRLEFRDPFLIGGGFGQQRLELGNLLLRERESW